MTIQWGKADAQGRRVGISYEGIDLNGGTATLRNPQGMFMNEHHRIETVPLTDNPPVLLRWNTTIARTYYTRANVGDHTVACQVNVVFPALGPLTQQEMK